jgi:tRNA U55 pseudouridine synthase TruB
VASGSVGIEQALSMDQLEEAWNSGRWLENLISMDEALAHLPSLVMYDEGLLRRLLHGQLEPDWEARTSQDFPDPNLPVRILSPQNRLVALWWPQSHADEPGKSHRLRVFGETPWKSEKNPE